MRREQVINMADKLYVEGERKQAMIIREDETYVEVSAFISQRHGKSSNITTNKVEQGIDTTDHIELNPEILHLKGITSNFDASTANLAESVKTVVSGGEREDKANDCFEALNEIWRHKELVLVSTHYQTYENMAIKSIDVIEDKDTGEMLSFSCSFHQLLITEDTRALGENLAAEKISVDEKAKNKKRGKSGAVQSFTVQKKIKELADKAQSGKIDSSWIVKLIKLLAGV